MHQSPAGSIHQYLRAGYASRTLPLVTRRTQRDSDRRLAAAIPGPETLHADVISHPEMLAVARLLIGAQQGTAPTPSVIASHLGFPTRPPHPLDPLQARLSQLAADLRQRM